MDEFVAASYHNSDSPKAPENVIFGLIYRAASTDIDIEKHLEL